MEYTRIGTWTFAADVRTRSVAVRNDLGAKDAHHTASSAMPNAQLEGPAGSEPAMLADQSAAEKGGRRTGKPVLFIGVGPKASARRRRRWEKRRSSRGGGRGCWCDDDVDLESRKNWRQSRETNSDGCGVDVESGICCGAAFEPVPVEVG